MIDGRILTAGDIVMPCIGCKEKEECNPITCELLEEWLELATAEYRRKEE